MWASKIRRCADSGNEFLEDCGKFPGPKRGLAAALIPMADSRDPPAAAFDGIEIKQIYFPSDQERRQLVPVSTRHIEFAEHQVELLPEKHGASVPDRSEQNALATQLFQISYQAGRVGHGFIYHQNSCVSPGILSFLHEPRNWCGLYRHFSSPRHNKRPATDKLKRGLSRTQMCEFVKENRMGGGEGLYLPEGIRVAEMPVALLHGPWS
jgi:hypothetical protein